MVAQAEVSRTTNLAKIKEWLTIASIIVVVAGRYPWRYETDHRSLQTDIRAIHGRLDRMDGRLQRMEDETKAVREEITAVRQDMSSEFKAVRAEIAVLSERLTRVETLLERDTDQPDTLDAQP